ncbi:MAG: YdcF family protein [Treponema sp.]|jgi:uncharacterized SAM-binding protein YcdF (DUF218 family)|nr:YdcF family protein [Treponema sp.]
MRLAFTGKPKQSCINIVLIISGILVFLYFTITSISWRRFDIFNFFVSLTGILIIILPFKIDFIIILIKKCPKLIQYLLKITFVCLIFSFVIFQSIIIYNIRDTSKAGADYIIVLGCQVAGEYASLPLLSRGYTAIRYLKRNPETKVVVTGGQGHGENIPEAEALRRLLLENKIDKERIYLEDKSKNTMENFIFSNELYNLLDKNILIVTSDYHMFRSLSMARKLKYKNVSGLPSKSQLSILPAFLMREYVTIIYYKILRRI